MYLFCFSVHVDNLPLASAGQKIQQNPKRDVKRTIKPVYQPPHSTNQLSNIMADKDCSSGGRAASTAAPSSSCCRRWAASIIIQWRLFSGAISTGNALLVWCFLPSSPAAKKNYLRHYTGWISPRTMSVDKKLPRTLLHTARRVYLRQAPLQ